MYIKCYPCNGTGYTPYRHIANGICFRCDGKGKHKATNEEIALHNERLKELNDQLSKLEEEHNIIDNRFTSIVFETRAYLIKNEITENDRQKLIKQINKAAQELDGSENEIKRVKKLIDGEKEKFIY